MEVTETYANLIERQDKVTLREGQGYRMLHDDFDSDWQRGDEPHGVMTFTDEPAIPVESSTAFKPLNPMPGVEQRLAHIEEWLSEHTR